MREQLSQLYDPKTKLFLFLFFTSQSTIFQLCRDESSWVEPVLSKDQCVLLKDKRQWQIENTRWVSFDIKFTRQGFENACWHGEACQATEHAFSKQSVVTLISKDVNLVFYLSVNTLVHSSNYRLWRNNWFCVHSASLVTSFKKCNVIMTW